MVLWGSSIIPTGHIAKAGLPSNNSVDGAACASQYTMEPAGQKKFVEKTRIRVGTCEMSITAARKTVGFG